MSEIQKQKEQKAELHSKLWEMANELRGNMEAYEFKNYILSLIFYRFLSERTRIFVDKILKLDNMTYEEAWDNDEYKQAIIDESIDSLGYVIEPKYMFSKIIEMIGDKSFSIDYLEEVVNSITESTHGRPSETDFEGLFEDMDLKSSKLGREIKQRSKLIGTILQTIDTIDFQIGNSQIDVLGDAYEYLIGMFAQTAGKKGGEFYTPFSMSKLLARLGCLGLTDVLSASDCACGSGSLLLQVGKYAKVRSYYGQELTSTTYNLARMNMLLHGVPYQNFEIANCDTLEDDTHFEELQFTVQVANPPYSTSWSADPKFLDDERFSAYGKLAPKSKADLAFVQHMIHHMADDGRIAVLLPHGVLFRGAAEEAIRKYIINDLNYLDAVIGLPANCFHGTTIPVCCLVFKKERNGNSNNICIIDASNYFTSGKAMNYITDEDIDRIVDAYIGRCDIEKYCHIASLEEVKENNYNLNIPRYVDTFEADDEVNIAVELEEISRLKSETLLCDDKLAAYFKELGL
ncbi:MAG: type I restriction-modification system subunit M [Peptostreptococcaceae bacterium]|nr:type I restriction-modification system subunit M [Peptostreptococcaceae bacterium]